MFDYTRSEWTVGGVTPPKETYVGPSEPAVERRKPQPKRCQPPVPDVELDAWYARILRAPTRW